MFFFVGPISAEFDLAPFESAIVADAQSHGQSHQESATATNSTIPITEPNPTTITTAEQSDVARCAAQ
jgi:hypothetical protein